MLEDNGESSGAPRPDVRERLRSSEEFPEIRQGRGPTERVPAGTRLLRVLIVDDSRDTADSLSMLLNCWGHDVCVTYSGAAALEAAVAFQPDVLLLDIAMPVQDGNQLARQFRRQPRFAATVLIAVTGYADEAHRLVSATAGFDYYLIKPVEPSTLEKMLLLEQRRLLPELEPRAEASNASGEAPRPNGILVVDDDDGVRGVLDIGMRQQGFAVWLAASGREALDLYRLRREAIDVILMDVRMPGLDGPQTLAALRELNPEVRCCFMSGDPGAYSESGLRDCGAAGLFRKPFPLAEVALLLWGLASRAKWNASLV